MSYQSWSVSFGEQPSAAKWNILGTNDSSFNDGTGLNSGSVQQIASTNFTNTTTGTTTIPVDGTIPQITEGTEFMTQAIVPKSASNTLIVEVVIFLSNGTAARDMAAALFQDATANALAAGQVTQPTATGGVMIPLRYKMTAGTTSSTTFRVRGGAGSAGTTTFNTYFSTAANSNITIIEYKV